MSQGPEESEGSAAEEAVKLLGALGDWARDQFEDHLATGAPECTYCPICRTVHVVREASPEVRAHLASAAASLMQAAASVLDAAASPGSARRRSTEVQTIDLDDSADEEWPEDGPEEES